MRDTARTGLEKRDRHIYVPPGRESDMSVCLPRLSIEQVVKRKSSPPLLNAPHVHLGWCSEALRSRGVPS
jgi:hypothetical protein